MTEIPNKILPFEPQSSSDELLQQVIDLFIIMQQDTNPDDPIPSREDLHRLIMSYAESAFVIFDCYLMFNQDNQIIAWMTLAFTRPEREDYEKKKHATYTNIFIKPQWRRKGLATAFLRYALDHASKPEITIFEGGSNLTSGKAFASQIGATIILEEFYARVYFADIDWQIIENWLQQGQTDNPNTKLIEVHGLYSDNEADLEMFAEFESNIRRDMPSGEFSGILQMISPEQLRQEHASEAKRGVQSVYFISVEDDGRFTGFTRINYQASYGHYVSQRVTGVLRQERGRGLGKWLKARMLLFIRENFPDAEFIRTSYANVNIPMIAINERIGFKEYKQQIFYKLKIATAKAYVGS